MESGRTACDKARVRARAGRRAAHLQQAHLRGHVPRLPHRVLVRGRQPRVAQRRAVGSAHDALSEKKVAEERGDEQVLQVGGRSGGVPGSQPGRVSGGA